LKIVRLAKSVKLRVCCPRSPRCFSRRMPMAAWLAWCKYKFSRLHRHGGQNRFLAWTIKPVRRVVGSPIFTPHGFWISIHNLLSTFWRREFCWHRVPLALQPVT